MIARTIRVIVVGRDQVTREEGWTAPTGWRIVSSEMLSGNRCSITLVKS